MSANLYRPDQAEDGESSWRSGDHQHLAGRRRQDRADRRARAVDLQPKRPDLSWRARLPVASLYVLFFFSSRRRHTILVSDWSSDVCSSDLFTFTCRTAVSPSRTSSPERVK